jgi:hypothetical protein
MDIWSDRNMRSFMAILTHLIQCVKLPTPPGSPEMFTLKMRHDLIGFHYLPGHHLGAHISAAFVKVADEYGIMPKAFSTSSATTNDAN